MSPTLAVEPIKVLIISGQNNHDWKKSTPLLAKILNSAGGIETTISQTAAEKSPPEQWDRWRPDFGRFDVVLLDYNGEHWPDEVKKNFIDYVKGGGSVLLIHAANNSFGGWTE